MEAGRGGGQEEEKEEKERERRSRWRRRRREEEEEEEEEVVRATTIERERERERERENEGGEGKKKRKRCFQSAGSIKSLCLSLWTFLLSNLPPHHYSLEGSQVAIRRGVEVEVEGEVDDDEVVEVFSRSLARFA